MRYWIFGDNILECERALEVMAASVAPQAAVARVDGPPYSPRFRVTWDGGSFEADLFPGYGRWNYDVADHLHALGAPLREATDAVILSVTEMGDDAEVEPLMAFEFCGALPAGNNAWQRCGRAVALAEAGVPYLYFAELGGLEMDGARVVKAPRLPNPLVPFAYLSLGETSGSLAMPVFDRSPSMPARLEEVFADSIGIEEARAIVADLLTGSEDPVPAIRALENKAVAAVQALSSARRREDTLRGEEWSELAARRTGRDRAEFLVARGLTWNKKTSIDVTRTFRPLVAEALRHGAVAAGATDIPICVLPADQRGGFSESLRALYQGRIGEDFLEWLASERPLVLVWLAGFKPRGDDSRPDRGLLPLARMIFGPEGIDYLSVIYGPGTRETWRRFANDLPGLAQTNGLWEAIVGLSDAILVDSLTADGLEDFARLTERTETAPALDRTRSTLARQGPVEFGEHDVDTVLHALFGSGDVLFEGMCNPPGGDWSGLSFQNSVDADVIRWTSLPRVTAPGSKRPDHVALLHGDRPLVLAVESKDVAGRLEPGIGPRLSAYVDTLLGFAPNIARTTADPAWSEFAGEYARPETTILSGVAFGYRGESLAEVAAFAEADLLVAVEFLRGEEAVRLRVGFRGEAERFVAELLEIAPRFGGRVEVHVEGLDNRV